MIKQIVLICLAVIGAPQLSQEIFAADPKTIFRFEADTNRARVPGLSWDTEGGDRAKLNLLRAGTNIGLRIKTGGQWRAGDTFDTKVGKISSSETRYQLELGANAELEWRIRSSANELTMTFRAKGAALTNVEGMELEFPFDPRATATTLLSSTWDASGKLQLPAIISAPDLGQVLLAAKPNPHLKGRLMGSRANHTVDFTLELSAALLNKTISLSFTPVFLPTPANLKDKSMWHGARRGWFNAFQPSAQWGDQNKQFSAPAGILANNVISDPVSCLLHQWADQTLLTPKFSSDIRVSDAMQRTIDWWLDHRTKPSGEVFAYWDHADMLDANASPLIASWDYVEATGDRKWLDRRIERLEFIAEYLVKRDVDGDGLIESTHSGNYGTLIEPMRAGSAYDTINAGHKDAYCNALIYRAFRCLADLEKQLKRREQQERYTLCAERLKASYAKTFFNPKTGWLAWWKSEDGELHDLSSPMINSVAICYDLIEPAQGREILDRVWKKIEAVGFKRFDLGVPITLAPVRRGDYLIHPGAIGVNGIPRNEDGSDTFGQCLNGGCMVSDAIYFITAHYIVGEREKGDKILRAMLERQEKGIFPNGGGFQNGVLDEAGRGAEFYTWDGKTTGYEGHLTFSYSFLQAIFLREPAFRKKLFHPLIDVSPSGFQK
ncbi:MAG: GH116 family glycosyl hydrolase [Verrucomicrobiota bacterium]